MVGNAKPSELVSYMCRAINSGSRLLIGIEKKEDKWHEKWGLASLYDNLVPSSSFRRPCYTLLLCELETNDTLDQERRKKPLASLPIA